MERGSPGPPGSAGPGPPPAWAQVLLSGVYALALALGAAGNALSARVVLKAGAGRAGRLRLHVLSLALAALLLLLVGVPVELWHGVWAREPWALGDLGCRGYHVLRELGAAASVLGLAGLSAERCLAVCQPLRARRLLTPRRSRRLLSLLWAASLGLALPAAAIVGQRHELQAAPDGGEPRPGPQPAPRVCTVLASRAALRAYVQVNVLVSFVLPLALTALLNGVTVSHLMALYSQVPSSSAPSNSIPSHLELLNEEGLLSFIAWRKTLGGQAGLLRHKDASQIRRLQNSIRVLRAIVAVYVVCWLPYHARRLVYCYVSDDGWSDALHDFYHYFHMVSNALFYVSPAVTPLLYNAMSPSFRKLFLEGLWSLCGKHRPRCRYPRKPRSPTLVDAASRSGKPPQVGLAACLGETRSSGESTASGSQDPDAINVRVPSRKLWPDCERQSHCCSPQSGSRGCFNQVSPTARLKAIPVILSQSQRLRI
ncbi:LOW QUALITY PROTEIN: neurotensin receptor type 2 [Perognathus longimembris pacificus]|uniref:LOW QUALITY PROTEIN: neurotensin receptor type 2 n=1 Tax=Perognathus longimembris pacificus TaxID=214514 RepID=UPI00201872E0|nr:LOW QUALITY PROTEIN: neurotensin receptor type 2 [Perognathus longimembris pacificus]